MIETGNKNLSLQTLKQIEIDIYRYKHYPGYKKDKIINHHMDVPIILTKDFLTKHHNIFKKIPRDITRF